ncbi:MAG: transposase, partial [Lentisphaerae bacterium]|nr:transposase [Lentisphaerota bacterium]
MAAAVQTFGELSHWHPHVHAVVSDGVFTSDLSACGHAQAGGVFIPLPTLAVEPFLKLWEHKVFKLLLDEGLITHETVEQMRSWQHSGFSVDKSVLIAAKDSDALERLVQYIARCPFSLDRILKITPTGHVVYKAEHDSCRRFPEPASGDLRSGVSRNFQVFDPLDFLAEVTQHIPNTGEHTIRYYGWYSNKSRGMRAKLARLGEAVAVKNIEAVVDAEEEDTPFRKTCRSRWAAMIKKVYEVDPLKCPKCSGQMRIISFLEKKDQADVIEKILKYCKLWVEPEERAP